MSFYDINFDQQAVDLLPPDKRGNPNIGFVRGLLKALQWSRDLVLGSYKTGNIAASYAGGTYNLYDQVLYKKGVYYSLVVNNTATPDDSTKWLLIQSNFIGVDERVKFNAQSLVLEYALNERFMGTYRPPPSASHSDIYFTKLGPVKYGFLIGQTIGSSVGQTISSDFIGHPLPFIRINNFQVNVLASIFALTSEKEIRGFVDLYVPIGINYTVVPY